MRHSRLCKLIEFQQYCRDLNSNKGHLKEKNSSRVNNLSFLQHTRNTFGRVCTDVLPDRMSTIREVSKAVLE